MICLVRKGAVLIVFTKNRKSIRFPKLSFSKLIFILGLFLLYIGWVGLDDAGTDSDIAKAWKIIGFGLVFWITGVTLHVFSADQHHENMNSED